MTTKIFNIGDTVSVLDEAIDGVVIAVKSNEVTIETTDKFTMTYFVNELVKIHNSNDLSGFFSSQSLSSVLKDKELPKKRSFVKEKKSLNEAKLSKVHKAAKLGDYPAVIVVVQDGKVIHQEPVSTPDVAPAAFNVMQEKYPKALLHLEDKTGKRLFSESVDVKEENDDNPCWDGYQQLGMKPKDGKQVPNCVKK